METTRAGEGFAAQSQGCAQLTATSSVPLRICHASESYTSRGVPLSGAVSVWDLGAKQDELHRVRCSVSLGATLMDTYT